VLFTASEMKTKTTCGTIG